MLAIATKQVSRARRLVHLLGHNPEYVLGRFVTVRDAYSTLRSLGDAVAADAPLRIGDLYEEATVGLAVASSGYLVPQKPTDAQVADLKERSHSVGPHIAPNVALDLQRQCRTLPLKVSGRAAGSYEELATAHERERYDRIAIATVIDSSKLAIVQALAADPLLHDAASSFLGYRARRVSSWLFWSFASQLSDAERRAMNQTIDFHYDVDGYNFMYANFYLVDTTTENGAHVLIEGSSRRKRWSHLMGIARLSDADALAAYGRDAERVIEGPAGFGFLEDSSCYHKALPPRGGDRLILQLRYR
jgi:hypothetical protein